MKSISLVRPVFAFVVALLVGIGSGTATAQEVDEPILGAWVVTVAVEGAPQPFRVLQTYEAGGTVTSENLPAFAADSSAPVDTLYLSTGVGAWERTESGVYTVTIVIMYGDIDGNLLALETVRQDVEVDASGASFRGPATFVATDPAGNSLYGGTSTLAGIRITVQDAGVPAVALAATPAG